MLKDILRTSYIDSEILSVVFNRSNNLCLRSNMKHVVYSLKLMADLLNDSDIVFVLSMPTRKN